VTECGSDGTQLCEGGVFGACEAPSEICNDQDDDCDGEVDEDLVRSCSTGCDTGTERCAGGEWGMCDAEPCEECPSGINLVTCNPAVPGDESGCNERLSERVDACRAAGCRWDGATSCTIGGSPSNASCYGGRGSCVP
jgi:hypothetical protein